MEEDEVVCLGNLWIILTLVITLLAVSGCRTEYYESGEVKSEGFHLGTQGLGEYYLIKFDAKE
jgi:hypothetical protein